MEFTKANYIIDAYDYVETGVDAANEEKGIPESFGGGSGEGYGKSRSWVNPTV